MSVGGEETEDGEADDEESQIAILKYPPQSIRYGCGSVHLDMLVALPVRPRQESELLQLTSGIRFDFLSRSCAFHTRCDALPKLGDAFPDDPGLTRFPPDPVAKYHISNHVGHERP